MRCKYLWSFALLTAVLAVSAWAFAADEEIRQPIATAFSEATQSSELADAGAKPVYAIGEAVSESAVPPKTGVPTPAKRKAAAAPKVEPAAPATEQLADRVRAKPADEALSPIPDAMEGGPISVEAASFKGITPGRSTRDDVEKAWGTPKETAQQDGSPVQLYSVEPFNRVEVSYRGDKVSSLLVRFDRAFPAEAVAKQLDLATIRPVLVSNELGEVLGLAYPERGVLFAFEVSAEPGKPSMKVAQLVLEPVSAESFVLRAETTLESRYDLSVRDLEQALSLAPENARAHWLHSRVLVAMEQYEKAAAAAAEAIRLEPENPHYRVTRTQILAQMGRLTEALKEAQQAVETCQKRPHVKARVLCLIGDVLASGAKPDYRKALASHSQALQLADPLTTDPHPAIRVAAKEVLIDAHLGAAHDIAWGEWKEKEKAVARWIERALAVANDVVSKEGGSEELVFRVHVRAMAAYVNLRGAIDPEATAKALVSTGDELIAATGDPVHRAKLQWDLGLALYDALQVCQMRNDSDHALQCGEKASEYLEKANQSKPTLSSTYLLGRLYFRLGTLHALREHDHQVAVAWFDKAIPLLDRASANGLGVNPGRHGESLVSMGVSYWEVGQQKKAVALTEKGIEWMERAVKDGTVERPSLAIPYNNLAAMHRKLGATGEADRYQELASRAKSEQLK